MQCRLLKNWYCKSDEYAVKVNDNSIKPVQKEGHHTVKHTAAFFHHARLHTFRQVNLTEQSDPFIELHWTEILFKLIHIYNLLDLNISLHIIYFDLLENQILLSVD